MSILIGVDAGGSRTTAAVGDGERELSRAAGPAGAVRPGRAMSAGSVIAATAREALAGAGLVRGDVLVVGAAGVGRAEEATALRDALRIERLAGRVIVTTDIAIALRDGFGGDLGILLLAGTGSAAVARLPDGGERRAGGYGWQMGDDGSGYAIARAALLAAGRAQDGRGPPTSLLDALCPATRSAGFDDLVRWSVLAAPTEVASLAPIVCDIAETGDAVAAAILADAARDLAAHVAVLAGGFPGDQPVRVVLAGGLLDRMVLRKAVTHELASVRRATIADRKPDPVRGALAIASDSA